MTIADSSNYLTSGILSWGVPIALVLGVGAWWAVVLVRRTLRAERDGQ